jgi:hypothetical protein
MRLPVIETLVARKDPKDQAFEDLLRAVARERMNQLGWGTSDLEKATGYDQGNLHRWFTSERKTTQVSLLRALIDVFGLDPLALFKGHMKPPPEFWQPYVPQHREDADGPRRLLTRAATAPGEKKEQAEHQHHQRVHPRRG